MANKLTLAIVRKDDEKGNRPEPRMVTPRRSEPLEDKDRIVYEGWRFRWPWRRAKTRLTLSGAIRKALQRKG